MLSPDDAVADIAALRGQDGGDVLIWGSASLVKTLLAEGLVDELNLMIEPILLGGGKRIFPEDGTARPMRLVKCVTARHRRADLHVPPGAVGTGEESDRALRRFSRRNPGPKFGACRASQT